MNESSQTQYHLLGWSLGGKIALKIASLLEAAKPNAAVKVYLLDTMLYDSYMLGACDPSMHDEQKNEYRRHALTQGIDPQFAQKVINNMDVENKLAKQTLTNPLEKASVILFKALKKDPRFTLHEYPHEYALNLPSNNIDTIVKNLSCIQVPDAHHGDILTHDILLSTLYNFALSSPSP
jgi:thioesterase domain-containing protein